MGGRYDSAHFYIFSTGCLSSRSLVPFLYILLRVSKSTLSLQILKHPQQGNYCTSGLSSTVTTHYQPKLNMDPYRILGVTTGASMEIIHSQYKKLCLQLHPDTAGEASTAAFQRVNAAYERIIASKKLPVEDAPEESYRCPPPQNDDPFPEPKYRRSLEENRNRSPEPKDRNSRQPGLEDFCKPDLRSRDVPVAVAAAVREALASSTSAATGTS